MLPTPFVKGQAAPDYTFLTCNNAMRTAKLCHMNMHGCHGISIIVRKPATFANGTVEIAMEEVTNLSVV